MERGLIAAYVATVITFGLVLLQVYTIAGPEAIEGMAAFGWMFAIFAMFLIGLLGFVYWASVISAAYLLALIFRSEFRNHRLFWVIWIGGISTIIGFTLLSLAGDTVTVFVNFGSPDGAARPETFAQMARALGIFALVGAVVGALIRPVPRS